MKEQSYMSNLALKITREFGLEIEIGLMGLRFEEDAVTSSPDDSC